MRMLQRIDPVRRYRSWQYNRLAKNAAILASDTTALRREGYFSQCGQDKYVVEQLFPGLRNGIFVDIGAHDGVSFSNTNYLEKNLDWTGMAIEPLPDVYAQLTRNRDCVCINGCVAEKVGTAVFRKISGYSEMLSGLLDQYDRRHLQRIDAEIHAHGGRVEEIEVVCYRLNALLQQYELRDIHYLNLDVEGAEFEILRSIDFGAVNIRVCGIENNYRDYRIPKLMRDNGYDLIAVLGDEFYVKRGDSTLRTV